ncbi:MAG: hypothetical protein LBW77_07735 [Verrucomicrobiota bacterium]|jgi:TolA protein|nr:hypothetical protein [Verrucomicrobiota bacterium]
MSDIPPRHSPDARPPFDAESGSGLVAMYNAASHANAESFPVLKAFQDYIEAERSQARKRVMQLSIFFAVLMGVVVTGFLAAGSFMLRNMSEVQAKLLDVALTQKEAPPPPAPVVVQPSPALEESVRLMSAVTTELRASLDKKLDGVTERMAAIDKNNEIEKLRAEFRQAQEQSAKRDAELAAFKAERERAEAEAKAKIEAEARVKAEADALAAAKAKADADALAAEQAKAASEAKLKAEAETLAAAKLKAEQDALAAAKAKADAEALVAAQAAEAKAKAEADALAAAKAKAEADRFPVATKEPPATPDGVVPPQVPPGRLATAIPLKTKNAGTIPWRVLIPD